MANKYYDSWMFQKIQSFHETNPAKAVEDFKEYLKQYPNDYEAYGYYASNLVTIGKIDEAEKVLNYLEERFKNIQGATFRELEVVKYAKGAVFFNRLRINLYKENYMEVKNLILSNPNEASLFDLREILFYYKCKLGESNIRNRDNQSYLFRQIIEYKEEDFLNHIKKHLPDYNANLDKPNKNVFAPDFPVNEFLVEIKKYMTKDKCLYSGVFENVYIFKYDECGREDNRLVNYVKVTCFNNTKNIITVLPVSYGANLPYIDLNYIKKEETKEIKKISAVERFNKRFKH